MKTLRIVFMGTPDFAVPTLDILHKSDHEIVGVITSVDKMGGRGGKVLLESAVKKYAVANNLKLFQPKNLKSPKFAEELQAVQADVQVVVAFRMLPEVVWNMPRLGTINLHGSLLPKYRGAAPINWAIINGDTQTGVTTFRLKHKIDTGDMIYQDSVDILEHDNVEDVHDKLMHVGAKLMLKTINDSAEDKIDFQVQNEQEVSEAPKIYRKTCRIDFNQNVQTVHNFIRGLSPYPGAWSKINAKTEIKILRAVPIFDEHNYMPGTIETDNKNYVKVNCLGGKIQLEEVQISGKKRMKIKDLLNGFSFNALEVI